MRKSILAGKVALLLFGAAFARASVPQTLNYQGAYREGGIPVSGMRTMTFRLTSADGSVEHWTSGPSSVSVSTGVFRTVLSLPASLDWGAITPYLEVSIGTTTLLPRDPLRSSVYAVHAATAELVAPGSITDASVAANAAISLSKLSSAGSLGLGTASPAGPLHVRAVGQDALFVSPVNAYVGLGTVTPAERLEVKNGSIKLTGIGASIVFADNTVMNSASLGSANAVTNATDLLLQGDSDANGSGDLLFKTGVSERLRVVNNGYVGVGTAVPASRFHLALPSSRDLAFSANAGGSWLVGLPSGGNTSLLNDQAVNIQAGGDGSAVGGVANNPHTGLGAALTLYGNDNAGAGSAVLSASGASGALILKTASSERARLTSSGDLGLGTASPSARLHVSGGGLQVGDASASTFSASGYLTLANLGSAPAGAPGRLYYDSASSKLRLNNGAGFVDIATGTVGGGPANMATTDTGQTITGGKIFTAAQSLPTVSSTMTIQGNAFSVGGSTLVVKDGNVGIGTASPANRLDVAGGGMILRSSMTLTGVAAPAASAAGQGALYFDSAQNKFLVSENGGAYQPLGNAGTYVARTGDAMTGPLTMLSGSTVTMTGNAFSVGGSTFVVASGKVGIGTASPDKALNVFGTANNFVAEVWNQGTVTSSNGLYVHSTNADPATMVLAAGNLSVMGDGKVGIGTASPDKALNVFGTANNFVAEVWNQGAVTSSNGLYVHSANADPATMILAAGNLSVMGDGKVGIGTSSPASKLDVAGNAQFGSGATKSTFSATGALTMASGAAITGNVTGSASLNVLKAGDTMTGQLTLSGSTLTVTGNAFSVGGATFVVTGSSVGIGTASPVAKLSVNGSLDVADNRVTGVADPVANTDAANKQWVLANAGRVKYMGFTPASTTGNWGGPLGGNGLCDAAFAGSHVCRQSEILASGATALPVNCNVGCWILPEIFHIGTGSLGVTSGIANSGGTPCSEYVSGSAGQVGVAILQNGRLTGPTCDAVLPILCCN